MFICIHHPSRILSPIPASLSSQESLLFMHHLYSPTNSPLHQNQQQHISQPAWPCPNPTVQKPRIAKYCRPHASQQHAASNPLHNPPRKASNRHPSSTSSIASKRVSCRGPTLLDNYPHSGEPCWLCIIVCNSMCVRKSLLILHVIL